MFTLHCELRHDNGNVEIITIGFYEYKDWRDSFDYLVDVHCRENTVELFPTHISLCGESCANYVPSEMEMVIG